MSIFSAFKVQWLDFLLVGSLCLCVTAERKQECEKVPLHYMWRLVKSIWSWLTITFIRHIKTFSRTSFLILCLKTVATFTLDLCRWWWWSHLPEKLKYVLTRSHLQELHLQFSKLYRIVTRIWDVDVLAAAVVEEIRWFNDDLLKSPHCWSFVTL